MLVCVCVFFNNFGSTWLYRHVTGPWFVAEKIGVMSGGVPLMPQHCYGSLAVVDRDSGTYC